MKSKALKELFVNHLTTVLLRGSNLLCIYVIKLTSVVNKKKPEPTNTRKAGPS